MGLAGPDRYPTTHNEVDLMRNFAPATCPHCGGQYLVNTVASHARRCAMSPEWYAATKSALDNGKGCIVSKETYLALKAPGAISYGGLSKQIGSWRLVAEAFGLRWEPTHGVHKAVKPVEERDRPDEDPDEIAALEARILAEDARKAQSLPACRRIDADHEVVWVLR